MAKAPVWLELLACARTLFQRENTGWTTNNTVPPNTSHGTRKVKLRSPVQTSNNAPNRPPSTQGRSSHTHHRGTPDSWSRVRHTAVG